MTETYQSKWNQFLNEEKQFEFPFEELKALLMNRGERVEDLQKQIDNAKTPFEREQLQNILAKKLNAIESYMDSLKRDMESNMADYLDFTTDDFIEDFENYVADKMGS